MEKRAQAAMEFLMTYGWAILAAVIVIAVLAAFGVFSPSKYIPTQCILSAPLGCDKNQVAATTTDVTLVLRNGGGEALDISSIDISGCGTNSASFNLADQATKAVTVNCSPALTSGSKFSGAVTTTYMVAGGVLNQTSTGSVVVKVP